MTATIPSLATPNTVRPEPSQTELFLSGQICAEDMPIPHWGPIGREVYERTYSRTVTGTDGRERNEVWAETVKRVVLGNLGFAPESAALPGEAVELFDLIYGFKATPAGRHLWVTGTDNKFSRNCLAGETEVITRSGTRKICDVVGLPVEIIDGNGGWVEAVAKAFGEQSLRKITMTRNGTRKVVYATGDHGWFTRGSVGGTQTRRRVTTDELLTGHRLINLRAKGSPLASGMRPGPVGIQAGFIYGDGSVTHGRPSRGVGAVANFCSPAKIEAMMKWFPTHAIKSKATGVMYAPDNPRSFKELPPLNEAAAHLYGWLAGYFAADGCMKQTGLMVLNSAKREDLEFVKDLCLRLGLGVNSISRQSRTGFGTEPSDMFGLSFDPHTFTEEFFLLPAHRENWMRRATKTRPRQRFWTVESVESTARFETVYCFEVPTTHSFVLADNLLTSNCWASGFSPRTSDHVHFLASRLFEGGGVGANYSRDLMNITQPVVGGVDVAITCRPDHPDFDEVRASAGALWRENAGHPSPRHYLVEDSREGWVAAWVQLIDLACTPGTHRMTVDVSDLREHGARLKTFGGQASGPGPMAAAVVGIAGVLAGSVGRRLTGLEAMTIDHQVAASVIAGGTRRSARMALMSWDDPEVLDFINCKVDPSQHWTTNISVEVNDKFREALATSDSHATAVLAAVSQGMVLNGEPGFIDTSMHSIGEPQQIRITNPCVTGDTLVSVADGRGTVPIGELAEQGDDVPVYTFDPVANKAVVRMMRAPRKTGEGMPIVKVRMDSGDAVEVTPNHKFILRNGNRVEAKDLRPGDSLRLMTRWQSALVPGGFRRGRQPYWYTTAGKSGALGEHRAIAEFRLGRDLLPSEFAHHIDFTGVNNSWDNIRVMSKSDHDFYHKLMKLGAANPTNVGFAGGYGQDWIDGRRAALSELTTGAHNPNFSGFDNDSVRRHAFELTQREGRKVSVNEWIAYAREHGLPTKFSGWRATQLNGGIAGMLTWAAAELGYMTEHDPRTMRILIAATSAGYDASIVGTSVMYTKSCERCGRKFTTRNREVGRCSRKHGAPAPQKKQAAPAKTRAISIPPSAEMECGECGSVVSGRPGDIRKRKVCSVACRTARLARLASERRADLLEKQLEVLLSLESPEKTDWQRACREAGVSTEMNRESSPFRYWRDLQLVAADYNHKVVSVEVAGTADVYNGTVDEFHTYFVGGFDSTTSSGRPKQSFVLTANCGEASLSFDPQDASGESCNLGSIDLNAFGTDTFSAHRAFALMARFLYRATLSPYPVEQAARIEAVNRRIGVGVMGLQGWLAQHGVKMTELHGNAQMRELLTGFRQTVRRAADSLADELGLPRPVKVTAVAPTGSISQMSGTTPGIHAVFSRFFIRRVRFESTNPKLPGFIEKGYRVEKDVYAANTMVVEFPQQDALAAKYGPALIEQSDEICFLDFMKMIAAIQQTFCGGTDGQAVSATASLPGDSDPDELRAAMAGLFGEVKGVTAFPEASRPQSPYERITETQFNDMVSHLFISELALLAGDSSDGSCGPGGACPVR